MVYLKDGKRGSQCGLNRRVGMGYGSETLLGAKPGRFCSCQDSGFFSRATEGFRQGLLLLLLLLRRFSRVRLCVTPEMASHQAPPSLGFSRQEHWSGLPFPFPMHESEK